MNASLVGTTPIETMLFLCAILFTFIWMFTHNAIDSFLISLLIGLTLYLFPMYSCLAICVGLAALVLYGSLNSWNYPRAEESTSAPAETLYTKDGRIIAYRYVIKDEKGYMSVTQAGLSRNGGTWDDGYLESDRVPTMKNSSGIYAAKSPHSSALSEFHGQGYTLVKVELSGRVIESTDGYRAQCCQVLEEL